MLITHKYDLISSGNKNEHTWAKEGQDNMWESDIVKVQNFCGIPIKLLFDAMNVLGKRKKQ